MIPVLPDARVGREGVSLSQAFSCAVLQSVTVEKIAEPGFMEGQPTIFWAIPERLDPKVTAELIDRAGLTFFGSSPTL